MSRINLATPPTKQEKTKPLKAFVANKKQLLAKRFRMMLKNYGLKVPCSNMSMEELSMKSNKSRRGPNYIPVQ